MKASLAIIALAILYTGCSKADLLPEGKSTDTENHFTLFTILNGSQFCEGNTYRSVQTGELKFTVRFDSSAIYETNNPENQYDINKLYGFSDNSALHHQFSARFGWRWSDGALRLFAYVYNEGAVV